MLITARICTAGKRPTTLARAIESLRAQVVKVPVLVIHNCEEYNPIEGVENAHEPGPIYEAFNSAVKHVRTPWVLILDDDDYLDDPYYTARLLNIIRATGGEYNYIVPRYERRMYKGGVIRVGTHENWTGREGEIAPKTAALKSGRFAHSGACYKRSLLRKHKYPIQFAANGDTYWQCEMAASGDLRILSYEGLGPILDRTVGGHVSERAGDRAKTHAAIKARWGRRKNK